MTKAKVTPIRTAKAARRHDRWVNETNSFGTSTDPMTRTYFDNSILLRRPDLDALYRDDWLAKRIVNVVADDATREWIRLKHDTDQAKADFVQDEMKRLHVQSAFNEALRLARLYGGDVFVIGANDGRDVTEPLGTIRDIQFFHNVDRFLAYPQTFYNDPDDINFGSVETYLVQRLMVQGSISSLVHESRVIRFDGEYMSPLNRLRNFGWHASVLQHVYESLKNFGTSNQAGAAVLQDFITKKLKISNLQDLLSSEDGESELLTRLALMASEMAIHNLAIYGADEDLDKMGTPINGLPDLITIIMNIICGAAGIPKSRLFQSESGALGGDQGKNDLRVHYDNVAAYQKNSLTDKMQRIIDLIGAQKGYAPGEVTFEWVPLWQLSDAELADVYQKTAQGDTAYITAGVLEPEEVALSRFGGDGINLSNITINAERREKYLDKLAKQPIDLDEGDGEALPGTQPGGNPDGNPGEAGQSLDPKGKMEAQK